MLEQYQNHSQDRRLGAIEKSIATINGEMGEVKIEMEKIRGEITKMGADLCNRLTKINSKISWFVFITPILTAVIGFLAYKAF